MVNTCYQGLDGAVGKEETQLSMEKCVYFFGQPTPKILDYFRAAHLLG